MDLFAKQYYCSIPVSIIRGCVDAVRAKLTDPDGVNNTFANLNTVKRLAISFTHHPSPPLAKNTSIIGQTSALSSTLTSIPHLESLALHWYKLLARTQERWDSCIEEEWLSRTLLKLNLFSLGNLDLNGVQFYPEFLCNFLQRTPLTHFTLQGVHIGAPSPHTHYTVARTRVSVLDFIASPECTITSLHLDDLIEHTNLVYFKVPGEPKFRRGDDVGPSEVRRTGAEVKVRLDYAFGNGKAVRSAQLDEWWRVRMRRYGPRWDDVVF
ncbi:hypothetical protein B0A48_14921 [Cryoendolithus antarcticus]|uniref:F-box domain-containing protein n=1 Tax=Cryoendolithus antarcticus TaxID=1507870 RepID=A0A1V8SJC1_9PEZI|nr:hypothetical protein B0A48_14921 [Cryoendolithus antarcticus]